MYILAFQWMDRGFKPVEGTQCYISADDDQMLRTVRSLYMTSGSPPAIATRYQLAVQFNGQLHHDPAARLPFIPFPLTSTVVTLNQLLHTPMRKRNGLYLR